MLYIHNQVRNSWEGTYKWAPQGVKTQILTKKTQNIDVMQISSQFEPLDNTK